LGRSLEPVLLALKKWGDANIGLFVSESEVTQNEEETYHNNFEIHKDIENI
jgi:DNA-binding HxlR family transcriptional regulator